MNQIVAFLEGDGPDGAGRMIAQVQAYDAGELERQHDFIQWLFPLAEPSAAVPGSPVLTAEDIGEIKVSPVAQANLIKSARHMAGFYDHSDHWLRPSDHNHLRITRIIKSLRLLVGDAAADGFRAAILARVEAEGAPVSQASRRHWMAA